jgi:hypothetical protein
MCLSLVWAAVVAAERCVGGGRGRGDEEGCKLG